MLCHFIKQVVIFCEGYFLSLFVVLANFFSFHTATKEKKQKNVAWLILSFVFFVSYQTISN